MSYFTVNSVVDSRTKALENKMKLNQKYYTPVAKIMFADEQERKFGTAMSSNKERPTYENFIMSEQADRQTPNNLYTLLKKVADEANAKIIYDIILGSRSDVDVKYIETHWARIERQIRRNVTRGISYRDLADFIMKDLYEGENENVQRQIEQTERLAKRHADTAQELNRTEQQKELLKKQNDAIQKQSVRERKRAVEANANLERMKREKQEAEEKKQRERERERQEADRKAIQDAADKAEKKRLRAEKKAAKVAAAAELELNKQRNIFVSPQKKSKKEENWGYNTPQDYINSTVTTSKKSGKKGTPIPIPIEGKGVSTQRRKKNLRFIF